MLPKKCIDAYRAVFPNDVCGYEEPMDLICIETYKTHIPYIQGDSETEEMFIDRLERSKKAGRNLFYEEWEVFEYIEGADY